jgi:hypothetical protein
MDAYTVYQNQKCPNEHLTCCKDYFEILGHCFSNI